MQLLALGKTFYGADVSSLALNGQCQTCICGLSVDQHRTCTALPVVAYFFSTRKAKLISQDIQQGVSGFYEDFIIVAVLENPKKQPLFTTKERTEMIEEIFLEEKKVEVKSFQGLLVDFAKKNNARIVIRGLRAVSDFEYEFRMALANHSLSPDIEVVALITNKDHTFLSGSTVREIAALGGDVSPMVPPVVEKALKERFQELGSDQSIVPHTSLRD